MRWEWGIGGGKIIPPGSVSFLAVKHIVRFFWIY
jgi:hypothetical protein